MKLIRREFSREFSTSKIFNHFCPERFNYLSLYQTKDSIYQTRYIRIIGWCSCALGGCMFISGLAIHATPQYPDFYQNPGKDYYNVGDILA